MVKIAKWRSDKAAKLTDGEIEAVLAQHAGKTDLTSLKWVEAIRLEKERRGA